MSLLPENAGLIIIDMQEKLFAEIAARDNVQSANLKLLACLKLFHLPILLTEQYRRLMGPTRPQISTLLPQSSPIPKMAFNCCLEAEFMAILEKQQRRQLILAGIETHICVLQTAVSLKNYGYEVFVAADACGSRDGKEHDLALELMRQAGISVSSMEIIVFQLLQTAAAPQYKEIIKIIKMA